MRVRSVYFKVLDMEREVTLWKALLQLEPVKRSVHWSEFLIGDARIGLLRNDFGETFTGRSCVLVVEFEPAELEAAVGRAKNAGAVIILDGLENPDMRSIVLASPEGNEFELCNCAAHG